MRLPWIRAMSAAMLVIGSAGAQEAVSFTPAPWCTTVLGADLEAGLKRRLLEALELAGYFEGEGTLLTEDLYGMLAMTDLSPAEYETLLTRGRPDDRIRLYLQLGQAAANGDWGFGYSPEIIRQIGDAGYRLLARKEALADARAGRPINALKRFDEGRARYLASVPPDTYGAKTFNQEPDTRAFVAADIMRQLMLDGFEAEATRFAAEAGDPRLPAYAQAMADGRAGRKAFLDSRVAADPDNAIAWRDQFSNDLSPLSEFVFQAVAHNRQELRDDLRRLGASRRTRVGLTQAGIMKDWLIERRAADPLLFLYTLFDETDRGTYAAGDDVVAEFAQRGDMETLARLQAVVDRLSPPDPERSMLRPARMHAAIRSGRFEDALALAGRLSISDLAQSWVTTADGPVPRGLSDAAGEAIPALLVLAGDRSDIGPWRTKFDLRQNLYLDLLFTMKDRGWSAASAFLAKHEKKQFFLGNAGRAYNSFIINLAFEAGADPVEAWYREAVGSPPDPRLLTQWFLLARQKCIGWTFTPFGSFDYGSANYHHVESALGPGIGSYILEDQKLLQANPAPP